MQKNLWFITALLVIATTVIGCTTQTASGVETTLESVYTRVSPSVVLIQGVLPTNAGGGALGSGFVWDTKGDIVTEKHVIDGASSLTVAFSDGTVVDASLIGTDADDDLAVIKVDPSGLQLHHITLANSTTVKVGQIAVAIGNPSGGENTMTVGFVGALVQGPITVAGQQAYIPGMIQIATPVNPGIGGVLLDSTGEVIGVTRYLKWMADTVKDPMVTVCGNGIVVDGNRAFVEHKIGGTINGKKVEYLAMCAWEFVGDKVQHTRTTGDRLLLAKQAVNGWFPKMIVNSIISQSEKGLH